MFIIILRQRSILQTEIKGTACLSLKVNFEELGYGFEVKDTILADLTMKVATNKITEEECREIIRKYIN